MDKGEKNLVKYQELEILPKVCEKRCEKSQNFCLRGKTEPFKGVLSPVDRPQTNTTGTEASWGLVS